MEVKSLRAGYSFRINSQHKFLSLSGLDGYRMRMLDKLMCMVGGHHYSRFERRGKPACIHCSMPRKRYKVRGERVTDFTHLQNK